MSPPGKTLKKGKGKAKATGMAALSKKVVPARAYPRKAR